MPNWLLPESLSDILPSEARKIEDLRRRLLDLYRSYGYELVQPPMLEHVESLLTGAAHDLDLQTFKVVDQMSGRLLGLRADITPQVARIDAHLLNRQGVVRLCYAGSVLHTRADGLNASREPLQIGAEIYGHAGWEADLEVQELVLGSLAAAGVNDVRLDLSHVGVYHALVALDTTGTVKARQQDLLAAIVRKDLPALEQITAKFPAELGAALRVLPTLYGPVAEVVELARRVLPAEPAIAQALDVLNQIASASLFAQHPGCQLTVDLGDLRGWQYHSGVMFSAYCPGVPNAIARGGRYDDAGKAFGRARAATGFSLELRTLSALQPDSEPALAIRAPWRDDESLRAVVAVLRERGEIVVQVLPGHEHEQQEFACNRQLTLLDGQWVLEPIRA